MIMKLFPLKFQKSFENSEQTSLSECFVRTKSIVLAKGVMLINWSILFSGGSRFSKAI